MVGYLALLALAVVVAGCGTARSPAPTATSADASTAAASSAPGPPSNPPATAVTTVAPTPTSEVHWERVARIPDLAADGDFGAVGFGGGYVVNDGIERDAVQFSPDGADWTPIELPLEGDATLFLVSSLATEGSRALALGAYSPCGEFVWFDVSPPAACQIRPASWVSDEGQRWRGSGPWTGPVGPPDYPGSGFAVAWALPTGGWDAAQNMILPDGADEGGQALWNSDDGLAWSALRTDPLEPVYAWAVADANGRRVAYSRSGSEDVLPTPVLSASTDGRQFERLEGFPAAIGETIVAGLAPVGSGPWVFLGDRAHSSSGRAAIAWTSYDLITWTTTVLPTPGDTDDAVVNDLAGWEAGFIATGYVGRPGDDGSQTVTWLSDDGLTWRIADARPAAGADDYVDVIADGPAGILGFGCGDPDCGGSTTVWRLVSSP